VNTNTIIYGRHPVEEALKKFESADNTNEVEKVYIQFNTSDRQLQSLLVAAKKLKISVSQVPPAKLSEICGSRNHQGIAMLLSGVTYHDLEDMVAAAKKPALLVVMDSLEDPHNVGAIIRTAVAAGADGIVIPMHNFPPINATVHKTSAGAVSNIKICKVPNLSQTLDKLKDLNFWIVGTDTDAEKLYTEFDYTMPTAIVIGSEGKGMKRLVSEHCDEIVKIPILGNIESLNASVSAGILLYEAVRQRTP
jgi:23S rRNA (guanosine2251-2'-O)-methyltransferase